MGEVIEIESIWIRKYVTYVREEQLWDYGFEISLKIEYVEVPS